MAELTAAPPSSPNAAPDKPTLDTPASGEKAPGDFMADIIGDFDAMASGRPEPQRDRDDKGKFKPTEKAPEPKKDPEPKPKEPQQKTEEPEPPAPKQEVKPVKAAELRTAYEGLKKKVQTELEPELQRLRSQVKEMEGKSKFEDAEPLKAQIKNLEAKNQELEQRIQYVDFTKSKKFNDEYVQPYNQAWADAVNEFKELSVKEYGPEDDSGQRQVTTRPATEADLIKLGAMRLSEMDEAAVAMFGASAPRAVNHIQNLRKLAQSRQKALQDAETKASEWSKQQVTERETMGKKLAGLWESVTKELETKLPKAFQVDAGDEVDKQAHTKGFALADLLFLGSKALSPEQVDALPEVFKDAAKEGKPLSEELSVKLHALARVKMANHDRLLAKNKKAQERIAELEKSLAEYEKSTPTTEHAGRSKEPEGTKDWLEEAGAELAALDK